MNKKIIYYFLVLLAVLAPLLVCFAGCDEPCQKAFPAGGRVTMYAFSASWCGPCHLDEKWVSAIEATGLLDVVRVDADKSPDLVYTIGVTDLPEYVVYVNGQLYYRGRSARDIYLWLSKQGVVK